MPAEASKGLLPILRKIPLFKGLSPSQMKRILSLCQHQTFSTGEVLCRSGTPSDALFILLSGELVVSTAEGVRVARILPVSTVGEMGVITGQPRSATVEAIRQSDVFTLQKRHLEAVLRQDRDARSVMYKNIIDVLSDKLGEANARIREQQEERDRLQGRVEVAERQVAALQRKLDQAVGLAAEEGSCSPEEITRRLAETVDETVPRLLVVDDESSFRRLVKRALPSFSVLEAADGREALNVVREEMPDLVLTDIRMPDVDGYDLLRVLRARFPHLPVVAVSGFVDAGEVEEYEFDAFLAKPVDLEELESVVRRCAGPRSGAQGARGGRCSEAD